MVYENRLTLELCIFYLKYYYPDIYFNVTTLTESEYIAESKIYSYFDILIGSPDITYLAEITNLLSNDQIFYSLSYYHISPCNTKSFYLGLSFPLIFSTMTQSLIEEYDKGSFMIILYNDLKHFSRACFQQAQIYIDTFNFNFLFSFSYSESRDYTIFYDLLSNLPVSISSKSIYVINCLKFSDVLDSFYDNLIKYDTFKNYPKLILFQLFFDRNVLLPQAEKYCSSYSSNCLFVVAATEKFSDDANALILEKNFHNLFHEILKSTVKYSNIHDTVFSLFHLLDYTLKVPVTQLYLQYLAASTGPSFIHPDGYIIKNCYIASYKNSMLTTFYTYKMSVNPYVITYTSFFSSCYWQDQYLPRESCYLVAFIAENANLLTETYQFLNILFVKLMYSLKYGSGQPCIRGTIVQYHSYDTQKLSDLILDKKIIMVLGCITESCRSKIEKILFIEPKPFFFIGYSNGEYCSKYILTVQIAMQEKLDMFLNVIDSKAMKQYYIISDDRDETKEEIKIFKEYIAKFSPDLELMDTFTYTDRAKVNLPKDNAYLFFNFLKFPSLVQFLENLSIHPNSNQFLLHFYQNSVPELNFLNLQNSYYVSFSNNLENFLFQGHLDVLSQFLSSADMNIFYYSMFQSFLVISNYIDYIDDFTDFNQYYELIHYKNERVPRYFLANHHFNLKLILYQIMISVEDQQNSVAYDNELLNYTINTGCKFLLPTLLIEISQTRKIFIYCVNATFLLYITFLFGMLAYYHNARILKTASLPFLALILIGIALLVTSTFYLVIDLDNSYICYLRAGVFPLSLNFIYILLFYKTWRVYLIFFNTRQIKLSISNELLFYRSTIYMIIQAVYFTIAWIVNPRKYGLYIIQPE